ncbi:oligomeric, coiled-coil, peripheral membrane protein [Scheffersomyces amazonensis]|uniref:oligomeric, coiled-coil, peripheral membrane protein n=1 Tax=Scheffersomyces amazonensis TaxID=1078765 RepID=UPI00315DD341
MTDLAYLLIYNAHNGACMKIPKPIRFHNLNEFKRFLSQSFLFESVDNIFLLTSFGIRLNFNLINELNDIYVFDKRLFANGYEISILNNYLQQTELDNSNNIISSPQLSILTTALETNNIKEITNRLKLNHDWTNQLLRNSLKLSDYCKELISQINIIFKSLNTIFQFATNFINETEKNFNNYLSYIKLIKYKSLHNSWEDHYKKLLIFPTIKIKNKLIILKDFLNYNKLIEKSNYINNNLPLIIEEFDKLTKSINEVNGEKLLIDKQIESLRNESIFEFKEFQMSEVIDNIKQLSNILFKDYNKLSTSDLELELFEIFNNHKNQLSPQLFNKVNKLYDHYIGLKRFKERLINESIKIFNKIANLQMSMVNIKNNLKLLTNPSPSEIGNNNINININNTNINKPSFQTIQTIKNYEDYLAITIDLPLLFGFILIEKRRQYEWYDFYSKGIVNNVSEQLSIIIDHEKLFRKIWLKKFGTFLPLLENDNNDHHLIQSTLPNIDVTLVGKNHNNSSSSSSFKILDDIIIDRDDILNYISILETANVSNNFIELLNKNFKDLIKSTNTMKKLTKIINSLGHYTSLASENKSKLLNSDGKPDSDEIEESDIDIDLNLIKGLKSRIKKLESLLHQQQFKNLTSWPVIRNDNDNNNNNNISVSNSNNRMSLIMDPSTMNKSDPTQLLQRRNSTNSKVLSSSPNNTTTTTATATTSIDKHLDNIRLKRENEELIARNNELSKENKKLMEDNELKNDEISNLKQEISNLTKRISHQDEEIKLNNKLDSKTIDNLRNKIEQRETQISDLQNNLIKITELNSNTGGEINKLNQIISGLRNDLNDITNTKNDLLSNLSSKEIEITKERNSLHEDIKNLQNKLDEIHEDYENLIELSSGDKKLIQQLNNIIIDLYDNIKKLSQELFEFFLEFCFILESMGLLLIKDDQIYKITRVKGLRSKKNNSIDDTDISLISIEKPSSKVIEDIENKMNWLHNFDNLKLDDSNFDDEQTGQIIKLYEENIKGKEQEQEQEQTSNSNSKLREFMHLISFKDNVLMQEDSINNSKFFLNAIAKRFRDVEGFAKRQTKEGKLKEQEISKLFHKLNSKISMNNFQVNDLVLFLPTRIDRINNDIEIDENLQPWAAFNIGAPHYFLKVDDNSSIKDKEWMVGRVVTITENKVTNETATNKQMNPFQLSVGVIWYMVEAKEVHT